MKRFPLLKLYICLALSAPAAVLSAADAPDSTHPTAYTALRLIQKTLGEKALERVVEVTGREGVPQPYLWRVTLKEPEGIREVDVAGGKISGQHVTTGKSAPGAGTMHLQELNLDSSGAFDAADAQAHKALVRFDSLNYDLVVGENGKPTWTLELFNQEGQSLGKMRLAAHNGTVTSVDGRLAVTGPAASALKQKAVAARTSPPPVVERRVAPPPPAPVVAPATGSSSVTSTTTTSTETTDPNGRIVVEADEAESGFFTRTGRTLDHTTEAVQRTLGETHETVKRTIKRTGATIQRFFVGHSDLDQEAPSEPNH